MTGPITTTCGLMYLKPKKCVYPFLESLWESSGLNIEVVRTFKLLGVIISSDLTWNAHIDYICTKASKRLYALRILKRSGAPANDLITVFCAFIRPVLEYASPVWHFSLSQFLANQIESIEKRALKIAFPSPPILPH